MLEVQNTEWYVSGIYPSLSLLFAYVINVFLCAKAFDIFIMQMSVVPLLSPYTVVV